MNTLTPLINNLKKYNNNIAIINKTEFRTFLYTYSKLHTYIKKFSTFLEKNNIKKGDKIAILNPNSPEYVIIFLGAILKGVILIPIDIRSTNDFIQKILQQTQPKLFFITKYKNLKSNIRRIYIEDLEYLLENTKPSTKKTKINQNQIVEIVYTSGTTGTPKGVILTHKNIASNINSLEKFVKIDHTYRFLSLLPLSHLFEQTVGLLTPLNSGSSIVYISSLRPSTIMNALKENVTNIVIVPRLLQSLKNKIISKVKNNNKEKQFNFLLKLAEKIKFKHRKLLFSKIHKKFKNIKFFIVGGAPLDLELEKFWELLGFKIVQGYGLTEASPIISCNLPEERKIGSVGKILPDITVKLGRNNEILVKGDNITKGYYKNKERTKQLFTKAWMHTGDIGYLDKENFLFIKGRQKDMIVTSEGINIYPKDIEEILNKIPGVKESCIVGIKKQNQEEIHAVLLLDNKNKAKQIIKLANSKLSLPQQIQNFTIWHLEDFPRTSTMKIKKNIVLEMLKKKAQPEKIITTKKDKLCSIISRIKNISINKIKPNSKLAYDLKLSSIDRIELISAIEQEFNIDIEEDLITNKTTIKQLKNIIQKRISKKQPFRRWTLTLPIRIIRYIFQILMVFPILKIFCRIKTQGKENLKNIKSPVIFVSNHTSHFDTSVILSKLPFRFKTNIAIATWAEFFQAPKNAIFKKLKKRILYNLGTILLNLYMFPRTKGFMKSIKYTGELIDKNYNILIFPEGQRTTNGEINPFKLGIGIIASNMKVPIIPIKIEGLFQILPIGSNFPKKRGKVNLKIGKALYERKCEAFSKYKGLENRRFSKPLYLTNESYIDIAKKIEDEVKSL